MFWRWRNVSGERNDGTDACGSGWFRTFGCNFSGCTGGLLAGQGNGSCFFSTVFPDGFFAGKLRGNVAGVSDDE
jgi:hypothetical protein